MNRRSFYLPTIALVVFATIIAVYYYYFTNRENSLTPVVESVERKVNEGGIVEEVIDDNKFTGEFAEMTVPVLRDREFSSQLGELKKYSESATYTSYLTSYNSDGLRVNGLLTIPKGDEPTGGWPAVVFVHGYIPPTLYKTTGNYSDYVNYIARNGFVVFKIDLRGHDQSEGTPGGGYYSSDYVIDTLNARAALQKSDFVNVDAVGLWGHSMAGNVLMRAFAARPEIPAVVIWAGAVYTYADMQEYGIDDNSYRPPTTGNNSERLRKRQALRDQYGDFNSDSEFWKQVAPSNYLGDLKGALNIHHAVDDSVVSVEYSRNLMSLLSKTDVEHKLYEYSTGGHNISGGSFSTAMQRTVDFYKSKLQ